ncbi:hypothetical protein [Tolypothrix sp. VBCCA 56010]
MAVIAEAIAKFNELTILGEWEMVSPALRSWFPRVPAMALPLGELVIGNW